MANEAIMLAKPFDVTKLEFPCVVTEKLDGVAADFYVPLGSNTGACLVQSRQKEPILSVQHIQDWLTHKLPEGCHLICELYIPQTPFKDISGKVRSHDAQPDLYAYVYDFYEEGDYQGSPLTELTYQMRMQRFVEVMGKHITTSNDWMIPVRIIPGIKAASAGQLENIVAKMGKDKPKSEGCVIRNLTGPHSGYGIGKRSWGMQKRKKQDTFDVEIIGFEEAISKDDEPLDMVGRIQVRYSGGESGVGPGKMTHEERKRVWKNRKKYIGLIAEVTAMTDESYEGLREGRFIRWREDKTTTD